HTLSNAAKKAYLDAEVCVMNTPSTLPLPGVRNKYDELVSIHQLHALTIHSTGVFLPWHRWYLHLHEVLLKACGYHGGTPYWDEVLESNLTNSGDSVIFTGGPYGFGTDAPCVVDGPFVGQVSAIGPIWNITDGCIGRAHTLGNPLKSNFFFPGIDVPTELARCKTLTSFVDFATCLYLAPHVSGHIAMGSLRGDSHASPSDPVFWLHHSYVDKVWLEWQNASPTTRTYAIGGNNKQDPAIGFLELPGNMTEEAINIFQSSPNAAQLALIPAGDEGDGGGSVVTLNHTLTSYGQIPDAKVADVMDAKGGYLCFEYV
ncbi:Di-copper centre-containing protein, partial [Cladorrhinum sp. PSN332]